MRDNEQELIGKIDAMLGKRDADVLSDKSALNDDFPRLTEVIDGGERVAWEGGDRRCGDPSGDDRRLSDRRLGQRRQARQTEANPAVSRDEAAHLLAVIEHKLTDLFISQQLRMEEAVRKVMREELADGEDGKP